jgi:two-component system chemotaxis response regulator CheB
MATKRNTKVLIIDDSAYNRRVLSDFVLAESDMTVVGKAYDGEEGLKLAMSERPDVITLDLEMPRMDGFTFLRFLMAKRPTPVLIISSHAQKENIFRALELGALDFVAKPSHRISPVIKEIRHEVIKKIRMARMLKRDTLIPPPAPAFDDFDEPTSKSPSTASIQNKAGIPLKSSAHRGSNNVIAIAASTGGPTALTRILTALSSIIDAGIVIVQHMPPRFTKTFAERLDKQCEIQIKEVQENSLLERGVAYIAPGESSIELNMTDKGLMVCLAKPIRAERYIPSADRLFASVARSAGKNALGIILTGMGDDGAKGVIQIADAGGTVIVEDETTAIIPGMPKAAVATGSVDHILPLQYIAPMISTFARKSH